MPQAAEKIESLLSALWLRNRPIVELRLDLIDRAIVAAANGTLTTEVREEAADNAHKLAGSLGMYGSHLGTHLAREMEILLDYRTPDHVRLATLSSELRRTLFPTV